MGRALRRTARWAGWLPTAAGVVVASDWLGNWPVLAKLAVTNMTVCTVSWWLSARRERKHRQRLQEQLDEARRERDMRAAADLAQCKVCHHYSCCGDECPTCGGLCRSAHHRPLTGALVTPDGAARGRYSLN